MDYINYALSVIIVMYMYLVFLVVRRMEEMGCEELTKFIDKSFFRKETILVTVMYVSAIVLSIMVRRVYIVLFTIPTLLMSVTIYVWVKYRRCFRYMQLLTDK